MASAALDSLNTNASRSSGRTTNWIDELLLGSSVAFGPGPRFAVVGGHAAVDGVGPPAAVQRDQGAVGQPADVHVHAAGAVRDDDFAPGLRRVVGDHHAAVVAVAHPLAARHPHAVEDRQQQPAARQRGNGLADEDPAVRRFPAAACASAPRCGRRRRRSGASLARCPGCRRAATSTAARPQPNLDDVQHGVLFRPGRVVGQLHRRPTSVRARRQAREPDADVRHALLGAGEPDAAKRTIRQHSEIRGVVLHLRGGQQRLGACRVRR